MIFAYLTFEPKLPLALWLLLATLAVGLLVTYALTSRGRLLGTARVATLTCMAIAAAVPLVILLNPTWIEQLPPPAGKPQLTILIDTSASMATTDAPEQKTRLAAAQQLAVDAQEQLKGQFEVRIRPFAGSADSTPSEVGALEPTGERTDLAGAIEASLDDRPQGQAILLLSDGSHNAGGGAARVRESVEKARAMAVPVYTMTLGGQGGVLDLDVSLNLPQEMAFVGQSVPVTVRLRQRGALSDRANVSLALDGKVIEQRAVELTTDGTALAVFQVNQPKSGLYRYEIKAEALAREVTDLNNSASLMLRVIDQPVRVLLLEGKPYWDTKFLVRTLASDKSIDLTSIVRLTGSRYLERTISRQAEKPDTPAPKAADAKEPDSAPLATHQEQWKIRTDGANILADGKALADYQIVVLGRDAEVFLNSTSLVALKKWLSEADGSLVCFRGSPAAQINQRLAELMPVGWAPMRESRFRVQLTESGQSMHWFPADDEQQDLLSNLPSLASGAKPQRAKPLAVVLATTSGNENQEPVITYQPVGNGRVVAVEGAGMWRWAFLPPQHQQHDELYGMLWRSLVRWLVTNASLLPSQRLALRSDKASFSTTEVAGATLLLRPEQFPGEPPSVLWSRQGTAEQHSAVPVPAGSVAGQFRVVFGKLTPGVYRAQVAGIDEGEVSGATVFEVRGNLQEQLDVAARDDLMKLIATTSGGAPLASSNPGELREAFVNHLAATQPQRIESIAAWDRWWVLVLIFGLWALTWGLRRRAGLV